MKFLSHLALMSALLFAVAFSAAAETPAARVDLVTHESILIRAPSSKVWPHIVDINDWTQGPDLFPMPSYDGKVRLKAIMPEQPDTVVFYVEQVEAVEGQRRTLRLDALDGTLIGYVSWVLTPQPGATLVEYHVYAFLDIDQPATEAQKRDYQEMNRRRFVSELEGLKRIVDGGVGS